MTFAVKVLIFICSSCLPHYEIFYRLLNHLAEIIKDVKHNNPLPQLKCIYKMAIPTDCTPIQAITSDLLYVSIQNYGRVRGGEDFLFNHTLHIRNSSIETTFMVFLKNMCFLI